jgi:hypothetical protein
MRPEQNAAATALEIESEKQQLLKAEADIENGWIRLRKQEDLAASLRVSGHDTNEAERLVQLMKHTLIEWECHRQLIEQRIAYLQARSFASARE